MILDDYSLSDCRWLTVEGPLEETVISSRIRLARNLRGIPFSNYASTAQLDHISQKLGRVLAEQTVCPSMEILNLEGLDPVDRMFLSERHLVSHEMVEHAVKRTVGIGDGEQVSVMINEEDHLRIQVLRAGLDLRDAYATVDRLDDAIESRADYAFHPRWGYLTACPTNAGTGLRCSLMMHLPGLVLTREMRKILVGVQEIGLVVRGGQGEGSEATGSIFQISNQATLGVKEGESLELVEREARKIARFEAEARRQLHEQHPSLVEDRIFRAMGILRGARMISSKEVAEHLSAVRMGIALGLVSDVSYRQINEMMIATRPAHLQKRLKATLDTAERDIARATIIRYCLN
jgi:protein arginine kinase